MNTACGRPESWCIYASVTWRDIRHTRKCCIFQYNVTCHVTDIYNVVCYSITWRGMWQTRIKLYYFSSSRTCRVMWKTRILLYGPLKRASISVCKGDPFLEEKRHSWISRVIADRYVLRHCHTRTKLNVLLSHDVFIVLDSFQR